MPKFSDFYCAGHVLLAQFRESARSRLAARYPGAPEHILTNASEGAIRSARKYGDCAELQDRVLDQAIRTSIRHKVLPYDTVLQVLDGHLPAYLHKAIQVAFAYVADLIAKEFAKPCTPTIITVQKPKRRRPWPPQASWSK